MSTHHLSSEPPAPLDRGGQIVEGLEYDGLSHIYPYLTLLGFENGMNQDLRKKKGRYNIVTGVDKNKVISLIEEYFQRGNFFLSLGKIPMTEEILSVSLEDLNTQLKALGDIDRYGWESLKAELFSYIQQEKQRAFITYTLHRRLIKETTGWLEKTLSRQGFNDL